MNDTLSARLRQAYRRFRQHRAIRRGRFGDPGDPLFDRLPEWVHEGDVVVDVGAAVGDYALRLSELAGRSGRVFAFEPVPAQLELLTSNVRLAPHGNITCLQLALSDEAGSAAMSVPEGRAGSNWYMASISEGGPVGIYKVRLDDLPLGAVAFIKVDAEGHDEAVLRGAEGTLRRHRPVVMVETGGDPGLVSWFEHLGYRMDPEAASPNRVFLPNSTSPEA